MGCSLIAQLLLICKLSNRVTIWTESALCDMLLEEDKAVGVELRKGDERWTVRSQAVFLAVAGFARNQGMREEYLQKPASADWTLAHSSGDDGNVLKMMVSKRAKTSLLQEAWGVPVIQDPLDGRKIPGIFELSKPHCILVNQCGRRFCSEARPYGDYNLDADAKAPSWLILDSVYLRKYTLGSLSAQESKIEMAVQRGYLTRSSTLSGLAIQLRIEPDNLTRTLDEWNEMCEGGKDIEFGKGGDEYQRFIGDESMKPNPNMGTISVPPFYAIPVFPGDAGTKGGLLTDEKGRVLHENGGVIDGLYASGNVTASPFGKSSIGAGITIGPAMTFAYTAVKHLCEKLENGITVGN
ncbi:fad binding domain-containing [Trichoderma arundinaceum]|uniref:Fad binding domain-containing n=1 Tax=Trichoderma arundinaceum TaxID=490622 RepID=A0A395N8W6_TRIAR|nr:fad binding domain-containing [Trichoderma arundinaceum]